MTTTYLIDHKGNITFKVGDEVENDDCRFFIGEINDSQRLCFLDKEKPFKLKNDKSPMAKCIAQGNYGASALTLKLVRVAPSDKSDEERKDL